MASSRLSLSQGIGIIFPPAARQPEIPAGKDDFSKRARERVPVMNWRICPVVEARGAARKFGDQSDNRYATPISDYGCD